MHRLTVGRMSKKSFSPQIRICGLWLLELGWEPGDKVEVLEEGRELVLKRIRVENAHQLKLPHVEDQGGDHVPGEDCSVHP